MSESLRNDGRVWVPVRAGDRRPAASRSRRPNATTSSSASTRATATSARATSPPGRPWRSATRGAAWAPPARAVYLDLAEALSAAGRRHPARPLRQPVRDVHPAHRRGSAGTRHAIEPAAHYTMGGLWVDYDLQSTVPGLFVAGEANFSDHGANRLGASALMQGLADGYLHPPAHARRLPGRRHPAAGDRHRRRSARHPGRRPGPPGPPAGGARAPAGGDFHRALGPSCGRSCGLTRNRAGLTAGAGRDRRPARGLLARGERSPAPAPS